jgi:hypothetical protein
MFCAQLFQAAQQDESTLRTQMVFLMGRSLKMSGRFMSAKVNLVLNAALAFVEQCMAAGQPTGARGVNADEFRIADCEFCDITKSRDKPRRSL